MMVTMVTMFLATRVRTKGVEILQQLETSSPIVTREVTFFLEKCRGKGS